MDRRVRDQPVSTDGRPHERRTPPDSIWLTQGFTVVDMEYLPAEAIPLDDVPAGQAVPPDPTLVNEST